ncbi:MAG: ABC transporter ATP-binding protein, partial [Henriciella sp.]|nr:ABC transporter ATP-binding protein [Henriciella sp.]
LTCNKVSKTYSAKAIVSEASLRLEPGERTALVGRSGAGKTTLLRLLAGMERPDSGTIKSGSRTLSSSSKHIPPEQRRIGLIFQDFALFPHLNVTRNITFGLSHINAQERTIIAETWLEQLALTSRRAAFPHQLSGGEQQRVAIARALAPTPVAILMDEPFSGLDPVLRDQAREVALSAIRNTQTPALMVTHDAAEALEYADNIAIMSHGRILQTGPCEHVYCNPSCLISAKALGPLQAIEPARLPTPWQSILPSGKIVHLRPEALQIDPASDVHLQVSAVRRIGTLTKLILVHKGQMLNAAMVLHRKLSVGDSIPISLNRDNVFAFPSPQS